MAFARGARTGVLTMLMSAAVKRVEAGGELAVGDQGDRVEVE
jgi:hypothetical protein